MSKINILPAQVYNRIAAGEVVDRPYSVVKELVENAIDAGATEIEIYVNQGGKQLIRVVDNGSGISRDDLHAAFLPHATSKISKAEDLESILTLGFRGEAVASIAAVSKMTITSKTAEADAYSLTSCGGEIGEIVPAVGENGTDVRVENLFFNTPVRYKFMKSDKAEENDVTTCVSRFILNRANVAFRYYLNDKLTLQSFGGGEEEAFVGVYGAATLSNCYRIDGERHGIRVRGYIGNQNYYKSNKSYQSVFLNGRYVVNDTIATAISSAYNAYLMKRQYPFYVLYVTVPAEIVDVNVHPNKINVRFAENQIVFGCINKIVASVLDGNAAALNYVVEDSFSAHSAEVSKPSEQKETVFSYEEAKRELKEAVPAFVEQKSARKTDIELPFDLPASAAEKTQESTFSKGYVRMEDIPEGEVKLVQEGSVRRRKDKVGAEALAKMYPDLYFERNVLEVNASATAPKESEPSQEGLFGVDAFAENKKYLESLEKAAKQEKIDTSAYTYAGKLFNTYLLYEYGDAVYIIDQHAAHERLTFNRLKENMRNRKVLQQPMLLPYSLSVNAFESGFIREQIENIREMGFDIEEFGDNTYKVSAVPLDLQKINLDTFFHEILGEVNNFRAVKLEEILKDKLASAACKASVKGGMDLTQEEIDELFRLMDGNMGLKCPHGRPVVVKMTKTELEKMFKRIV
ncbi:MAG: DNA mismatch repair endonuclease MutL [Clostridia bacterium]|nr:DNA mismatch repair endonuclease MutL [Clostridia bacterium]